jgi:peptide deformylase
MAILKVSNMGHPVLRQKAQPIPPTQLATTAYQQLVDDMINTMLDYEGIGLAASQVFRAERLLVVGFADADPDDPDDIPLTVLVNPEWLEMSEEENEGWEGCLSIPNIRGIVSRSSQVRVKGLDRDGAPVELTAEGLFARVLQHEIDHLDGILFLDRMEDMQTLTFLEEYQRYWKQSTDG